MAGCVVENNRKSDVCGSGPVDGDNVEQLEGANKMVSASLIRIFYTKVVDNKSESSAVGDVPKQAGGGCLMIAMVGEMGY